MTPLQKLPKNVRNLGKIIVAKGFEKLPKVQKIALFGHTAQAPLYKHSTIFIGTAEDHVVVSRGLVAL